jgi:hypothetical protein
LTHGLIGAVWVTKGARMAFNININVNDQEGRVIVYKGKKTLNEAEYAELMYLRKDQERRREITNKRMETRKENLKNEKEKMKHEARMQMSYSERQWYERRLRYLEFKMRKYESDEESDAESVVSETGSNESESDDESVVSETDASEESDSESEYETSDSESES